MTTSIGEELTILESRLNRVEQRSAVAHSPAITVVPDPTTGVPVIHDSLTWDAGWAPYAGIHVGQPNPALPGYPGLSWMHPTGIPTEYGPPQVLRVGGLGFLTGLVFRSGSSLAAGGVHGLRMFMLPDGWRPQFRAKLPCLMSGSTLAMADVEVRPDRGAAAGGVYFITGQGNLDENIGWIALQGAFPCGDVPAV